VRVDKLLSLIRNTSIIISMKEIFLDVSELPAPEPLFVIVEELEKIKQGVYLRIIHRMEPKLLYPKLRLKSLKYQVRFIDKEILEIYVFHFNDELYIKGLL